MIPRYYQNDAVFSIWDYFKQGNKGNPIVAMPTGTGKSLVIASFIKSVHHYYPNQRILKLTHVKELIEQNFEKLIDIWPTAPAGIFSAGLKRKDFNCAITYAGIGSIAKHVSKFGHIDIIVVDECHLISPKQTTQYGKFIIELKKLNPHLKVIGLTATPFRLGQGMLTEQPSLFTDICFDLTEMSAFNKLVAEGYLALLVPKPTSTTINLDGVGKRGGEYIEKDVQAASDREEITYGALQETMQVASDRDHWLIFATGIDHAEHIQEALCSMQIECGIVHSRMPNKERDQQIHLFKIGYYRALVNVGVLTTGFDFPEIDLIVMLRPTSSPGLWVQMLGRGTRPLYADGFNLTTIQGRLDAIAASDKQNCLVLDFAGNTARLGPINDPVIPKKKGKGGGDAPVRICDNCHTYIHASLRECPHCGHIFPISVKFRTTAGTSELMATSKVKEPEIHDFKVDKVVYAKHVKKDKPDAVKATYYCGIRMFTAWVCLFHGGFARKKALDWWYEAHPEGRNCERPEDIDEALDSVMGLNTAHTITVRTDQKYPEILNYKY